MLAWRRRGMVHDRGGSCSVAARPRRVPRRGRAPTLQTHTVALSTSGTRLAPIVVDAPSLRKVFLEPGQRPLPGIVRGLLVPGGSRIVVEVVAGAGVDDLLEGLAVLLHRLLDSRGAGGDPLVGLPVERQHRGFDLWHVGEGRVWPVVGDCRLEVRDCRGNHPRYSPTEAEPDHADVDLLD